MTARPEGSDPPPALTAQQRWGRRAAYGLAGLLALWLLAWVGLPPLFKWQLETQASAALGRQVTVQSVSVRPWSLELTVEGLRVATADGQGEQLALQRLYLDAELQSLLRLAPVVDALQLEGLRVQLRHLGQGHYDIDDVLARLFEPKAAPAPMPRFALFNVALQQGAIDFVDDAAGVHHELRALELHVPFLSNIGSRREVATEPRLSFRLNGSDFDSRWSSTPFLSTHKTEARLQLPGLSIQPYLRYWPAAWPLQPRGGSVTADLTLRFEQREAPWLSVSGQLGLQGFQFDELLAGQASAPLLGWKSLQLEFDNTLPLQQHIGLKALRWDSPALRLTRDGRGQFNLERIAAGMVTGMTAAAPAPSDRTASGPAPAPSPSPWKLALEQLAIQSGTLHWQDKLATGQADVQLQNLSLEAQAIRWPENQPVGVKASVDAGKGSLRLSGTVGEREGRLQLTLDALPLSLARPYLSAHLAPELQGSLAAEAEFVWNTPADVGAPVLELRLPRLALSALTLGPARSPLASWGRLGLSDVVLQPGPRRLSIGKVLLERPQLQLSRDAQGRWMFEDWLVSGAAAPLGTQPSPATPTAPWQVALTDFRVLGGQLGYSDSATAQPVRLDVSGFDLLARDAAWPAVSGRPVSLEAALRLATRRSQTDAGRLSYRGQLNLPVSGGRRPTPLRVRGALDAVDLPLHALEPYVRDSLNLDLRRADTSFKGQFDLSLPPSGPTLSLRGDAAVEDFRASTLAPAEDLLDWKALSLRGIELELSQGDLRELTVAETVLSDYFARVIIDPSGRINLQDLVRSGASPAQPALLPPAAAPAASGPGPVMRFGPIALVKGRVHFSDRFIQPNYSANLSELTGRLEAFDNRPTGGAPVLADLSLRGRAEGSATLEVSGRLNPLAKPLALDIQGAVRELELPPLSPYSVKYAGYGIERGKLSMDVRYQVNPDGQLTASNKLILNQLTFGERVEGSSAPNLPVKLAVALLADRNGVIDLDLPISGSINDPQFRIGPIVFRMIFSLIGKAVTAPFALIANALGGGGEELNQVTFAPGSTQLEASASARLDQVAKALASRTGLQLTVTGYSDLEQERSGYQRQRLQAMVQAEKRRRQARDGGPAEAPQAVSADEYPTLLRSVYRRANITKPRNLLGMATDLPVPEMEALLMASIPVGEEAMRELAVARSVAVKDYLTAAQVAPERLFLGAPVTRKGDNGQGQPRAELKLALP